jgi:hypothetical protein
VSEVTKVVPEVLNAHAAVHHATGATYQAAGSANHAAHSAAAAAAVGPIGAHYLAAYVPAQANNLTATSQHAHGHHAHGAWHSATSAAFVATDNA